MKILFLTLADFNSISERNIYTDLLREFVKHGHEVRIISPTERRNGQHTHVIREKNSIILKLRTGNMQKTGMIEKGISMLTIEQLFVYAIRKYFAGEKFDLVLYCTPPITFCKAVNYVKRRDHAKTYLMLKDIFPQGAVDLGVLKKSGLKGILYRYFRTKEKKLYRISDQIGCMSEANVAYVLKHNPEISSEKVEVCPNCIEPVDLSLSDVERMTVRKKYGIPEDRTVFVYGGNLGKPQGIGFMLKCLHSQRKNRAVFFLIVGIGTEYPRIEKYIEKYQPENIKLMSWIPKKDYDKVIAACDVGMIFLDDRFTIPNFPSRLLNYMAAKLPVLACTDVNTDIGKMIVDNGFGWWCESTILDSYSRVVQEIIESEYRQMGINAFEYLVENYFTEMVYKIITGSLFGIR